MRICMKIYFLLILNVFAKFTFFDLGKKDHLCASLVAVESVVFPLKYVYYH